MSDPITKTVKAFSSMNTNISSFASAASNPKHFPKVAIAVILSSGLFGFGLMQIVDRKREVRESITEGTGATINSRSSPKSSWVFAFRVNPHAFSLAAIDSLLNSTGEHEHELFLRWRKDCIAQRVLGTCDDWECKIIITSRKSWKCCNGTKELYAYSIWQICSRWK